MRTKILTIIILLAFCACGFTIYTQQKEIRQLRNATTRYKEKVMELMEEKADMSDKQQNQTPVFVNLPDLDTNQNGWEEYEKSNLEYENMELEYENQRLKNKLLLEYGDYGY